jgi:SAM-dependent methyltransferase
MGDIIAINGYRANSDLLRRRFTEGGYHLRETGHFLLFTRSAAPSTIIVHRFAPCEIDADIGDYFLRELKPAGVLASERDFGNVFGAVVCSLYPRDAQRALHLYGSNTLHRYQDILRSAPDAASAADGTINAFAGLYRRVFEWLRGESFLDVGCSFGFLPLLIAERFPLLARVVGVDILTEPFTVVRALAQERHLRNVRFSQADLLASNFGALGCFDTVVALHVLEHLTALEMYRALKHLWQVTARRLIIAVPYEDGAPEIIYGHRQIFTREKLEGVGEWCKRHLEQVALAACEDCADGLLCLERAGLPASIADVDRRS